ncbi:hypothetical protein GCM10025884_19090 [Leuconostoc gelidum subsp. gelidum]|nr:hypothetical protein GCM10025884_19090 [Leuconostoc gelidum subsp. gelidum]
MQCSILKVTIKSDFDENRNIIKEDINMAKEKHGTGFWGKLSLLLAVGQLLFSLYHEIQSSRSRKK